MHRLEKRITPPAICTMCGPSHVLAVTSDQAELHSGWCPGCGLLVKRRDRAAQEALR
jgi:hypothetical protein